MYVCFLGIVSYVHQGNFVVQLVEINLAVNAVVVGIASVVHGHNDLYILVVVCLTLRLVSVQIQQLVESVSLGNTVLLVHRNQYRAKKVLLILMVILSIRDWWYQIFQIDTIPIRYHGFLVVLIPNFDTNTSKFKPSSTVSLWHNIVAKMTLDNCGRFLWNPIDDFTLIQFHQTYF